MNHPFRSHSYLIIFTVPLRYVGRFDFWTKHSHLFLSELVDQLSRGGRGMGRSEGVARTNSVHATPRAKPAVSALRLIFTYRTHARLQPRLFLPPTSLDRGRRPLRSRIMDRRRAKISGFFIRLVSGLGRKRRLSIVPFSQPSGSTVRQTSLSMISHVGSLCRMLMCFDPTFPVFELPDELILLILFWISPDPQLTGRYARFSFPYNTGSSECQNQRASFLRPLSATCRAMRLRLLPWVWERVEVPRQDPWKSDDRIVWGLNVIVSSLRRDVFLAGSVRYFSIFLCSSVTADSRLLIKVLEGAPPVTWTHLSCVCQVPKVPPKSSHAGDWIGG